MFKNINDILGRISEKNRDMAGVLEEIFGTLKEIAAEVEPMRTDRDGFDESGYDRDGFDKKGLDKNGMTETEKKEKEEDDEALTGNCVYKTSEAEAETGLPEKD